jgi:hypothetical protein
MRTRALILAVLAFSFVAFPANGPACVFFDPIRAAAIERYFRTELYFGRDRPNGSVVSDDEWNEFLDREVTTRFPEGFTVLDGLGQYKDKSGSIIRENSKVIVFLYPRKARKAAGTRIDEIRAAYCKRFDQESVMRIDFRRSVDVDF